MNRSQRRVAFYGGTFDPIHNGHLAMAAAAAATLGLNRVYFVPALQNPLKSKGPNASAADRLEMLRLALGEDPRFSIWEGELGRSGPSYTLHSVDYIERVYPNSHLFWIIGSDQLGRLRDWYGIARLVEKISFILVCRPGFPWEWPGIPGLRVYPVNNEEMDVSGTQLRKRIAEGFGPGDGVPPAVADYISRTGLYRPPPVAVS
jgi:nicotinate-nucleotide adenylyltransferase